MCRLPGEIKPAYLLCCIDFNLTVNIVPELFSAEHAVIDFLFTLKVPPKTSVEDLDELSSLLQVPLVVSVHCCVSSKPSCTWDGSCSLWYS